MLINDGEIAAHRRARPRSAASTCGSTSNTAATRRPTGSIGEGDEVRVLDAHLENDGGRAGRLGRARRRRSGCGGARSGARPRRPRRLLQRRPTPTALGDSSSASPSARLEDAPAARRPAGRDRGRRSTTRSPPAATTSTAASTSPSRGDVLALRPQRGRLRRLRQHPRLRDGPDPGRVRGHGRGDVGGRR